MIATKGASSRETEITNDRFRRERITTYTYGASGSQDTSKTKSLLRCCWHPYVNLQRTETGMSLKCAAAFAGQWKLLAATNSVMDGCGDTTRYTMPYNEGHISARWHCRLTSCVENEAGLWRQRCGAAIMVAAGARASVCQQCKGFSRQFWDMGESR